MKMQCQDSRVKLLSNYLSQRLVGPSLLFHSSDLEKVYELVPRIPRVLILARQDDLGIITFLLRDIGPKYNNIEIVSIEDIIEGHCPKVKVVMLPIEPVSEVLNAMKEIVMASLSLGDIILIGSKSIIINFQNELEVEKWIEMKSSNNFSMYIVSGEPGSEEEDQEKRESYTWGDLDDIDDLEE